MRLFLANEDYNSWQRTRTDGSISIRGYLSWPFFKLALPKTRSSSHRRLRTRNIPSCRTLSSPHVQIILAASFEGVAQVSQ